MIKDKKMDRREFLRRVGAGSAAAGMAALTGCTPRTEIKEDEYSSETSDIPTDQMTYRTNPKTGDKVSLLGYGCMRWPNINVDGKEKIDQETVNRLVDTAIAHGVNYFDTSPAYCRGMSERATGIALSRHPRDKYFIATKMSNFAPQTWNREASIDIYNNSLKELQTDYIDYMLLHCVGTGSGMREFEQRFIDNGILDFLMEEREAGRIRNLGFSYHGDVKVFDHMLELHDKCNWDFAQIQLNYLDWKHAGGNNTNAEYLYNELGKRNIPVVVMEPLLGGRLSKVHDHVVARFKQKEPDRSVASWAFRYAGTFPEVLTVLSGMTFMEHLADNLRSFCPLKPLDEDEVQYLYDTADLIVQYPTIPCNDCKYCMPCPYGLDIPAILTHYNKCVNEGNVPESTQSENYRKARQAFLVGYDRSVPKLRQANHCIGCRKCVSHCPQNINIPRQMRRIDHFVEQLKQNTLGENKQA
ncbi:MAG: aldo/keto reductase [Bacteroidales bacterium]|nr:aldo/keto reductase [Bacteroidales bacterium]